MILDTTWIEITSGLASVIFIYDFLFVVESFGLWLGTKESLLPQQNMSSCYSEEI